MTELRYQSKRAFGNWGSWSENDSDLVTKTNQSNDAQNVVSKVNNSQNDAVKCGALLKTSKGPIN